MDKHDLAQFAPGFIGSAGALVWIRGTLPRKIIMLILGVAASYYGTADFAKIINIEVGLSGFLVGMFSMTAADWLFRTWDQFALGPILKEWVRQRLGLPTKGNTE